MHETLPDDGIQAEGGCWKEEYVLLCILYGVMPHSLIRRDDCSPGCIPGSPTLYISVYVHIKLHSSHSNPLFDRGVFCVSVSQNAGRGKVRDG